MRDSGYNLTGIKVDTWEEILSEDEKEVSAIQKRKLTDKERRPLSDEIEGLKGYHRLASSIGHNAKGGRTAHGAGQGVSQAEGAESAAEGGHLHQEPSHTGRYRPSAWEQPVQKRLYAVPRRAKRTPKAGGQGGL